MDNKEKIKSLILLGVKKVRICKDYGISYYELQKILGKGYINKREREIGKIRYEMKIMEDGTMGLVEVEEETEKNEINIH